MQNLGQFSLFWADPCSSFWNVTLQCQCTVFEHKVSQAITYRGYCFDRNVKMPLDQSRKCFSLQAHPPAALQVKIEVNLWEHAFTSINLIEKFTAVLIFEFLFYFCSLFMYAHVMNTHSYM